MLYIGFLKENESHSSLSYAVILEKLTLNPAVILAVVICTSSDKAATPFTAGRLKSHQSPYVLSVKQSRTVIVHQGTWVSSCD